LAEIAQSSFTGGEYYVSSVPGGVATSITNSTSKYYIDGTTICSTDGATILTHCKKNTNDSLYFNAKTHFCRDKSSKPADSLEVVELCFKATDPKKAGTIWDGINYQCDPTTGDPARSCGPNANYYNETTHFCYSPTNTIAPKCKDDPTQYNPEQAFCSYTGNSLNRDTLAAANIGDTTKQVAISKCGAAKTEYNRNGWNWEYCTNLGTTSEGILACGVNEEPETKTAVRCQCLLNRAFKNPWTNTCVLLTTSGAPSGQTNCTTTSDANTIVPNGYCCGTIAGLGTSGSGSANYNAIYLGNVTGSGTSAVYTCAISLVGVTGTSADANAPVTCSGTTPVRASKSDATCIALTTCNTNNANKGTITLSNGEVVCNDP